MLAIPAEFGLGILLEAPSCRIHGLSTTCTRYSSSFYALTKFMENAIYDSMDGTDRKIIWDNENHPRPAYSKQKLKRSPAMGPRSHRS